MIGSNHVTECEKRMIVDIYGGNARNKRLVMRVTVHFMKYDPIKQNNKLKKNILSLLK